MSTIAAAVIGVVVVAASLQWYLSSGAATLTLQSRLQMLKPGDDEVPLDTPSKDVVVAHRLAIDIEVHRWVGLSQHTITDTRAEYTQQPVSLLVLNECLGTNPPLFAMPSDGQRRVHIDLLCKPSFTWEKSSNNLHIDGMTFSRIDEEVYLFHAYSTVYLVGRRNKTGQLVYHTISPTIDAIAAKYRVTQRCSPA